MTETIRKLFLVTMAGCAGLIGEPQDGEPAAPATDAGVGPPAATIDGGGIDTGKVGAPITDAGAPDVVLRGCAAYRDASFCDDFDAPTLGTRWTTHSGGLPGLGSSLITLVDAGYSAPQALRASLPSLADAGAVFSARAVSRHVAKTTFRVRARVRLVAREGEYVNVLAVERLDGPYFAIEVMSYANQLVLKAVGEVGTFSLAHPVPTTLRDWTALDLTLHYAPSSTSVSLRIEDETLGADATASGTITPDFGDAGMKLDLGIGINVTDPSGGEGTERETTVLSDDVAVWKD